RFLLGSYTHTHTHTQFISGHTHPLASAVVGVFERRRESLVRGVLSAGCACHLPLHCAQVHGRTLGLGSQDNQNSAYLFSLVSVAITDTHTHRHRHTHTHTTTAHHNPPLYIRPAFDSPPPEPDHSSTHPHTHTHTHPNPSNNTHTRRHACTHA